jgi:glycosyltransferase involved in cell wall biosynthesis
MISAVITNLNGYHELWFTLQSVITELDSSGYDFEIIVADNGSEESELNLVRTLINNLKKKYEVRLVVWEQRKSCPGIRTAGMIEAKGDLVCFMDGHVILKSGYFTDTVPLFDDPDVYIVFSPEVYTAELLYEYTTEKQLEFEQSDTNLEPMSNEPYPTLSACQACTMIRKDFLNFFFPEDELNYIPYSMDEPNTPILAWMFGKKVLMNPKTYFAHRPWAYTPGGDCDYESWRPMGAYALAGKEGYEKSMAMWKSDKVLNLPEKHREFIEKNAVVKFKDLHQHLTDNGVRR